MCCGDYVLPIYSALFTEPGAPGAFDAPLFFESKIATVVNKSKPKVREGNAKLAVILFTSPSVSNICVTKFAYLGVNSSWKPYAVPTKPESAVVFLNDVPAVNTHMLASPRKIR